MKWVAVLAFFGFVFCVQAWWLSQPSRVGQQPSSGVDVGKYNDQKCTERGGTCQLTSSLCSGSRQYFSGFCGGPSNRRCCVPLGKSGCMRQTETLACRLLSSNNIEAAKNHPSGERDNAFAFNNLRDMCQGRKASRSSYRCSDECNAPGGQTCLSFNLLNYLLDLQRHVKMRINELAGACHSCQSRHYSGLAVDLHKNGNEATYMNFCRAHDGYPINEKRHVHCQFYDGPHPNWVP